LRRELHEELGITTTPFAAAADYELTDPEFTLQIWLLRTWSGDIVNAAPDEHDALGWFVSGELPALRLAEPLYLELLREVLAGPPH
jgi:8-oxo-dGTP pyrophosphatase MutT (NUDIX family)